MIDILYLFPDILILSLDLKQLAGKLDAGNRRFKIMALRGNKLLLFDLKRSLSVP